MSSGSNSAKTAAIFIGDELSAAGFRLIGIETVVTSPEAAGAALARARPRAELVIMTADFARQVPVPELEAASLSEIPALAIIPDVLFRVPPPDLAKRLRSVLGIET
jgi:vacuolar-type H+-ATPase subunit F/Vma7